MARLKHIDMDGNRITLVLEISHIEYKLIGSKEEMLVVPKDDSFLSEELTTGKIGNGNRIMVPNKLLKSYEFKLPKKVPARIFDAQDEKYLLIRLKKSSLIPEFEE